MSVGGTVCAPCSRKGTLRMTSLHFSTLHLNTISTHKIFLSPRNVAILPGRILQAASPAYEGFREPEISPGVSGDADIPITRPFYEPGLSN